MHNLSELRVVTFNIHKGFGYTKKQFNLQSMRDSLQALNCDLVFLQEVLGEHTGHQEKIDEWPDASQFEYIADTIWPHFAYGKNAIYESGHHGNAILSKYPFIDWENINLSNNVNFSRSLLHGIIAIPNKKYHIHTICFHFALREKERERQVKVLCDHILANIPLSDPLIIAGDSNDLKGRFKDYFDERLQIDEAHHKTTGQHAKTYPAAFPLFPLDRIYYRGLEPISAKTLDEPPWNKLSDHLPLYTRFNLCDEERD